MARSGLRAKTIHKQDGDEGHAQIDETNQHGLPERGVEAAARLRENRRQIIENGVDAGDLLEKCNH